MKDYRSYSFWLETAGDDLTPRPRLDGSIAVDGLDRRESMRGFLPAA